ncbi:hypothetical protein FRC09_020772 [Ceratobasidium sp. 395]|nr:hypothetical protein FRC09_020772 [Ceratobasidium sp. 395]
MLEPCGHASISSAFSSSEGVRPAIRSALAEWKSARSLLASTIQSYLSACTDLHTACIGATHHLAERPVFEETLVTIDSELESLALEENRLRDSRILFTTTRNKSARLSCVNTLPPEVLVKIFALSKNYCEFGDIPKPDGFASVCSYWRQTAVAATDLWAHIDISPTTPESRTELLLGRSNNKAIHVHAIEPMEYVELYDLDEHTYGRIVWTMMKPLIPHLCRLRTFSIESFSLGGEFISAIFNGWSDPRFSGGPMSLSVERPASGERLCIRSQSKKDENLERLLLAVSTLHLDGVTFDWASGVYRDLVDLQLNFMCDVRLPIPRLFNIFSASPALHTLKLKNVIVHSVLGWRRRDFVAMECLEVLGLTEMEPSSAGSLLSLITLPELRAELSIGLDPDSAMDHQLLDFLTRCKPIALHCYCRDGPGRSLYQGWKYLLQLLPRPQTLVLDNFRLTPGTQSDVLLSPPEFLPPPYSVVFLRCNLDLECLWELFTLLRAQDLRFEMCSTPNPRQDMEGIQTLLLEICPELQCSVSDVDSTFAQLECRSMFVAS